MALTVCGSKRAVGRGIEDEMHVLLDCYPYRQLREQMLSLIMDKTGYDVSLMQGDREWLRDFLIGCGVPDSNNRVTVAQIGGTFLNKMLKRREKILQIPRNR